MINLFLKLAIILMIVSALFAVWACVKLSGDIDRKIDEISKEKYEQEKEKDCD